MIRAVALLLPGCLHLPTGRVEALGDPAPLPSGPPASGCEETAWLSVVPARGSATGRFTVGDTYGGVYTRWVTLEAEGIAVLRGSEPLRFDQVDVALRTPPALEPHRSRMERTRLMQPAPLLGLMGLGLAGVTGGLLAVQNDALQRNLVFASLVPFTVGGVMAPIGLVVPSPKAQARYGLRDVLFVPPEDDLDALAAEVDAANERTRAGCVGR